MKFDLKKNFTPPRQKVEGGYKVFLLFLGIMNPLELEAIARKEARIAEETEIMNIFMTLKQEIKTLHLELEDSKEVAQSSPGWRYNRKAEKLDEKIESYEITLDAELKTINSKYDIKLEKLEADLEARIKKLREEFETEKKKIHLDRERGLEAKTREYDIYIIKREKEKQSILTDKEKYVENMPKKIHDVRKRRLLRQKIEAYQRNIKRHNEFYKKNPELQVSENWGLEFMNQKGETQKVQEEKKIHTPLAKNERGVENIFFSQPISGNGSETRIEKIIPEIPTSSPSPPKKATKKKPTPQAPSSSSEEQDDDTNSVSSYEKFRQRYNHLWGENLPQEPEPL